ncbi:MAG: helix-turn-helix transcriptional regulator [Bacillota bacterium]
MKTWREFKGEIESEFGKLESSVTVAVNDIISSVILKRIEKGWTQAELAATIGVQQSAIARIESFVVVPRLDTLLKVLHVLGLSLAVRDKSECDETLNTSVTAYETDESYTFFETAVPFGEQEFVVDRYEGNEPDAQYFAFSFGEVV